MKRYDKDGNLLDDLTYHYYDTLHNNKLSHITDAVNTSNFLHDLETQNPGNYSYDSVGNMISDASRTLTVQYTYSNRPKFINFANGRILKMKYNPFGYRFFSGKSNKDGDVFIYSSQGQLIGKYKISGNMLKLDFVPIYEGTKRIGIVERENVTWFDCPNFVGCPTDDIGVDAWRVAGLSIKESFLKADRKYELVDHLGNVRVVIANQRMPIDTNEDSLVDYYKPLVESIHDYYPFGWEKQLTTVEPYPFTYQGQLFDRELGWQYYRYRNYDPMIARFHQVEPLIDKYPWLGYVFSENYVVYTVEVEGLEAFFVHGTWSDTLTWLPSTMEAIANVTGNKTIHWIQWNKKNEDYSRRLAAMELVRQVLANRKEGEPLVLVGHSHGGNIAILAANILKVMFGIQVDYLITIATPVRPEYQVIKGAVKTHINIYFTKDPIQVLGGQGYEDETKLSIQVMGCLRSLNLIGCVLSIIGVDFLFDFLRDKFGTEVGPAGRVFNNAVNIGVYDDKYYKLEYFWGHVIQNALDLWFDKLKSVIQGGQNGKGGKQDSSDNNNGQDNNNEGNDQ